ncbi:hypothetical protein HIM_06327 [Hirsutella minnesotensis 3608]|uniref:5'-3' DNA helicase ZGRF1-like N-terminal domain-containing protein n=1 Tax=Hirsutella minnesotensis 3608 TaxID=1043627 RepID=A0A0F7ZJE6_9HYPO|nr:hypothetical protein HIM_06327 [Hirsutella minnesotensis 3608]
MSYAVRRPADASRSGSGQTRHDPTTTTSAAVLDYACLFTHDLRRKQKRWQDGRLKYHTFNRRIMVYDDRGNFIGDSHWQATGGEELDEGEELELDRGSAIVQVADLVGRREQDLAELLDKRAREVEQRRASAAARTPVRQRPQQQQQNSHFQLNHRPLSAIVPSPGPIGRAAIPDKSPYEARCAEASAERPAAKRRRVSVSPPSKKGFAQSLFGAKLTLSASTASTPSPMPRVVQERPLSAAEQRPESRLREEDEDEGDIVMLDEPPQSRREKPAAPHAGPRPVIKAVSRESTWKPPRPNSSADRDSENSSLRPIKERARIVHVIEDSSPPDEDTTAMKENDNPRNARVGPTMAQSLQRASETSKPEESRCRTDPGLESKQARKEASREDIAVPLREPPPPSPPRKIQPPPERQEKRTALRIKSRKRRGLLMMTEQRERPSTPLAGNAPKQDAVRAESEKVALRRDEPVDELEIGQDLESEPTAEPSRKAAPASPERTSAKSNSGNDLAPVERRRKRQAQAVADTSESERPPPIRSRKASRQPRQAVDDSSSSDDDEFASWCRGEDHHSPAELTDGEESEGDAVPRRRARKRQTSVSVVSEDESKDQVAPREQDAKRRSSRQKAVKKQETERPLHTGPRIAKLARKSVKIREIIGFVLPNNEDLVPAAFATATSRLSHGVDRNPVSLSRGDATTIAGRDGGRRQIFPPALSSSEPDFEEPPQLEPQITRDVRVRTLNERPESVLAEPERSFGVDVDTEPASALQAGNAARTTVESATFTDDACKEPQRIIAACKSKAPADAPAAKVAQPATSLLAASAIKASPTVLDSIEPQTLVGESDKAALGSSMKKIAPSFLAEVKRTGEQTTSTATVNAPIATGSSVEAPEEPVELSNAVLGRQLSRQESSVSNSDADGSAKPRIANPATRGKKAARKEDAAGQPIQAVVLEPPIPLRAPRAEPVSKPQQRKESSGLAGFSRANGGTWSRHAEDLLGMTRPMSKTKP